MLPALAAILLVPCAALSAIIDITTFGADGSDEIDDTAEIRAAADALQENDILLIPESSLYYKVTHDANLAIDEPGVHVVVRGRVLMTGTPTPSNHLFIVTADRCAFRGEGGVLEGSGSYFASTDADDPALIRFFNANDCFVSGLRLRNGPRFWIYLGGAERCSIRDCVFEGGPTQLAAQSQGIFLRDANDILIRGNRFIADSGGGQAGSWIGSADTHAHTGISILGNQFDGAHEHAVNCSGLSHSVIADNIVSNALGAALKTEGPDNVIANNNMRTAAGGGIEIGNGARCVIAGNMVKNFGLVAVQAAVTGDGGGAGGVYTENLIIGNSLLAGAANPVVHEAIRILAPVDCSRTKITGNLIVGAGRDDGNPALSVASGSPSHAVSITGNTFDQCPGDGIVIDNVNYSIVSDNVIRLIEGGIPFQSVNVTETNKVTDNLIDGTFPPLAIQSLSQAGNEATLQWNMGTGSAFSVGWTEDLEQWNDLPVGYTDTWTDTNVNGTAEKYYRVETE
jgi:hypothetical protein